MSRQVHLEGLPSREAPSPALRRLGRHLWARLNEYEGVGVALSGPGFYDQQGVVTADFPGRDNGRLVEALARRYHIYAALLPDGRVRFALTPAVSFADLDYVQGAIGELLGEE